MMTLGEIAAAGCVLYLSARPDMFARSLHSVRADFAARPGAKQGLLGLVFVVLAPLLCWSLLTASLESPRIEGYSLLFPFFPILACGLAALGWQMLFAGPPATPPTESGDGAP